METNIKDRFLMKFKKEQTIRTYNTQIEMFYNYIESTLGKKIDTDENLLKSLNFDLVENYFYYIDRETDYKKATINLKIEVIREFFEYCTKRKDLGIMEYNYADTIDQYSQEEVKKDKKKKYIPTATEVKRILDKTYEEKYDSREWEFNSARNRFLVALLSSTGLRINEALNITMKDIETVNGGYMINVDALGVKNEMNKRVPVPESIVKYFEEYRVQRMIMKEKFDTNLLFFSIRGNKLDVANVNRFLREITQEAGLKEKISCHCFRHFLTSQLKSKGVDSSIIYKILGWSEKGIDSNYDGEADDKRYDSIKLKVCNVLMG